MKHMFAVMLAFVLAVLSPPAGTAQKRPSEAITRGRVYAPAYSTIYFGDRGRQFNLSVTLSVRNTGGGAMLIERIDLYDGNGKLVSPYIASPVTLAPRGAFSVIIKESDRRGGAEASFFVTWSARGRAAPPFVEAIMIGTQGQQGISFTSRGVPLP